MLRQLLLILLPLALGAGSAFAQNALDVHAGGGPKPYTHLDVRDAGEKFQFAIVTDRTGGMRPGVFEKAVEKLNLLQPAFVMSIGDLIEGSAAHGELVQQWDEFDSIVHKLEMPFFYVPGNHDVSNSDEGRRLWQERVGPLFYHFLYKDVLFIAMNSDDATLATLGDEQIAYVKKALDDNPKARWTFVFFHKPIWTAEDSRWLEIEALLKDRPHTVFTGHRHDYMKYERNNRDYFVLGTTGGSMAHEGIQQGEVDHIVWVTVDQDEPEIANLLLDGILDKNFRTEASAAFSLPLLSGKATPETQVWLDDAPVDSITAKLPVQNPLEVPLEIIGLLRPTDHLSPTPARFNLTLKPGESAEVPIVLNALDPVRPALLQSMLCEYSFIVHAPDQTAMMFSTNSRLYFDSTFACPPLAGEAVVDGRLQELPELPFRSLNPVQTLPNSPEWRGASDASLQFGVASAGDYVYIAAKVTDDLTQVNAAWRPSKQDGIEIRFDARPADQYANTPAEADKTQEAYLYIAANPLGAAGRIFEAEKLPQGCQFVCIPTEDGYVVEGLIPQSYLASKQGGDWQSFRLNLALYDFDELADSGVPLWWRPSWAKAGTPATSGQFHRTK